MCGENGAADAVHGGSEVCWYLLDLYGVIAGRGEVGVGSRVDEYTAARLTCVATVDECPIVVSSARMRGVPAPGHEDDGEI